MRQFTAAVVSYNGNKPHNKPHNKLHDTGHGNQPAVNGRVEEGRRRFSEFRWALNFAINYKFGAHHRVESFLPSSSPPYSAHTHLHPHPQTHTHRVTPTPTTTQRKEEKTEEPVSNLSPSPLLASLTAATCQRVQVKARRAGSAAC